MAEIEWETMWMVTKRIRNELESQGVMEIELEITWMVIKWIKNE